jgi:acyl-CoA hydrolase
VDGLGDALEVRAGDGDPGGSVSVEQAAPTTATRASMNGAIRRTRPCYGLRRCLLAFSTMVASMSAQKPVAASQVTLVQLMELTDANIAGIVHGGVVMKLVDTAAGLAAIKHCGGLAVTVSMDEMSFLAPVHVGDTITVKASVNAVYTTSLEVGVRVEAERILTGERAHTASAYLVYVALDEDGNPRPVPRLLTETVVQQRREREAGIRRQTRLEHREQIRQHRRDVEQLERPIQPSADEPGESIPPHLRF